MKKYITLGFIAFFASTSFIFADDHGQPEYFNFQVNLCKLNKGSSIDKYSDSVNDYIEFERNFIKIKDSKALFVNKNGRRLSRQSIWSIVKDCTKSINLSIEVTPHTLRHSFATELLKGGANIREVQELMGHSSLSATQIYTSLDNNWVKKEYSNSHPRA